MSKKVKVTLSLDPDVCCILDTLANEFGLNRSELVEKLSLSCGYNRLGIDGLISGWFLSFHPRELSKYHSKSLGFITLYDVIEGHMMNQDLPDDIVK